MTYIDYINQFWRMHASVPFSANEVYLYFFLLKECNAREWQNPFDCSNRLIVLSLGVSEPTIIDARNKLKNKGLLDFEPGKRNEKSPVYYLNDLSKPFSKPLSKTFSKDLSKPFSKPFSINIRHKNKDNKNIDNNSSELFPEPKKKSAKKAKVEVVSPSLSEVKRYFAECGVANAEKEAEKFFYYFESLGWRTSSGAKIKRWDSRANLWISENLERNGNKNNSTAAGNFVTVTGAENETGGKRPDAIAADLAEFIDSIPIG